MNSFKKAIGFDELKNSCNTGYAPFSDTTAGLVFPERFPTLKQVTELCVTEALKRSKGNQNIAARLLGISPQALSKRLKKQEVSQDTNEHDQE